MPNKCLNVLHKLRSFSKLKKFPRRSSIKTANFYEETADFFFIL